MINISELRLGNVVSFKGLWHGKVRQVSSSGAILIEGNEGFFDSENIDPIPITKQLLYDMGADDFPNGEDLEFKGHLIAFAECRNEFYHKATSVTLKTLHQLQNLYFALTGYELQIILSKKDKP